MEWWETLLISLMPAIIAAAISLLQLKRAKKEFEDKYSLDKKSHISQTRFDTEFAIYKELSGVFVNMIRDINQLFPKGLYYTPVRKELELEYNKELYDRSQKSLNEATRVICSYAIFVPEDWFNRFMNICNECYIQNRMFFDNKVAFPEHSNQNIIDECFIRNEKINNEYGELIKELRKYIKSLENGGQI